MLRSTFWSQSAVGAVFLLALAGCGDDNPLGRLPINGEVTLNGAPLKDGVIEFQPVGDEPTSAGGSIVDGKYEFTAEQGLAPGKYHVFITAADPDESAPPIEAPGESRKLRPDLIPPEYNIESTLIREVKAGQENKFDFPIQSSS